MAFSHSATSPWNRDASVEAAGVPVALRPLGRWATLAGALLTMGREDTGGTDVPAPHLGALGGEDQNLRAAWTGDREGAGDRPSHEDPYSARTLRRGAHLEACGSSGEGSTTRTSSRLPRQPAPVRAGG